MMETKKDLEQERRNREHKRLYSDLSPLMPFIQHMSITDIFVYGNGGVSVYDSEKGCQDTNVNIDVENRLRIIQALANVNNVEFNPYQKPVLETTIPEYKLRFTAIIPPWTEYPEFTMRRPAIKIYTLEDYVESERMTNEQHDLVCEYIRQNKNIVVSGSTGSGKTTFTNAYLDKIAEYYPKDRFYIIEDTQELQFKGAYKTQLLIKSYEAELAIATALRFTPKHIIFGEIRNGKMTKSLMEAWNTGHPGNLTTVHANNAYSTVARLEGLLREEITNDIPDDYIGDRVDVIINLSFKRGFGAFVSEIREVREILAERRDNRCKTA
jgi:type IV secretion system protein VirB11